MNIFQIHPSDIIARRAILDVLNRNHDRRIRQGILDFWREGFRKFSSQKKGGNLIFLIALEKSEVIGISCCGILSTSKRCFNSMTVVKRQHRNRDIGTKLLKAKLHLIDKRYSDSFLVCYISKSNEHALRMSNSVGLEIVADGGRERENKESTKFYVLSSRTALKVGSKTG